MKNMISIKKLSDYAYNVYSQFGEDGIIERIFKILGTSSKVCIEFGAWDGFYLSSTANLWTNGWKGILIEADEVKYKSLVKNVKKYDCHCINTFVSYEGPNTFENILKREGISGDVDFLSIDIDGDDYYIFESLKELKPRLIACEYNPTIPIHMDLISEKGSYFGCSAPSLVKLAEKKNYRLIAMTDTNCFFVRSIDFKKFEIYDTNLESIAPTKHLTYFITGYDGNYILSKKPTYGCAHSSAQKFIGECYAFPVKDNCNNNKLNLFKKLFFSFKKRVIQLRMRLLQARLAQIKHDQIITFNSLLNNLSSIYNKLNKYNIVQFTTPVWENYNAKLEKVFLPYPPFSFLRDPIIISTMFVTSGGRWLKEELTFLEKKNSKDKLKFLLQEEYVGMPLLLNFTYLTSHNSIHHLYHLIRFLDKTKCNLDQINTIVEWGGGYGNMAKIFKRLKYTSLTYIIIDTPLFSSIQWLYLATVLGEENVNLLQNPEDSIHVGKINLIPICFVDRHKISADLFISTWALSESSKYSQDYVVAHKWFNAKHILLAYQNSSNRLPNAERVGEIAADIGAVIEDIEFLSGNHYAFR
jgi:hypothetical protein